MIIIHQGNIYLDNTIPIQDSPVIRVDPRNYFNGDLFVYSYQDDVVKTIDIVNSKSPYSNYVKMAKGEKRDDSIIAASLSRDLMLQTFEYVKDSGVINTTRIRLYHESMGTMVISNLHRSNSTINLGLENGRSPVEVLNDCQEIMLTTISPENFITCSIDDLMSYLELRSTLSSREEMDKLQHPFVKCTNGPKNINVVDLIHGTSTQHHSSNHGDLK